MVRRLIWTLILIIAVSMVGACNAAALKYGDKGDGVKEVQEYLIAQCLLDAEADGVYGSSTVQAIKDFQSALGLEVDGVCGAQTYKILRAAAYDEIDITTFKLGDYVPEPPAPPKTVNNAVNSVLGIVDDIYTTYAVPEEPIVEETPFELTSEPELGRAIRVEATAYSRMEPGMSDYTATGTFCQRGVIATDPSIIPLGTRVYIPGYGYAVAEDTGGAIIGHKIDVAFDTVEECYEFGRQFIEIYIID